MIPIKTLRPTADNSVALREAFQRLVAAREENNREIDALAEQRAATLATGTVAEIDKGEENARRRRIYSEQLEVFETELRRQYEIVSNAEDDAAFNSRLAELNAEVAAWNGDMSAKYPALATALTELITRESKIIDGFRALFRMDGSSRNCRGRTLQTMCGGMVKASAPGPDHLGSFAMGLSVPPLRGKVSP